MCCEGVKVCGVTYNKLDQPGFIGSTVLCKCQVVYNFFLTVQKGVSTDMHSVCIYCVSHSSINFILFYSLYFKDFSK